MAIKIDETTRFQPNFGTDGLIGCITQSAHDGRVLMFAWMNRESLELTLKTGEMHYWSRSRQQLWHKGATSGNVQKLIELRNYESLNIPLPVPGVGRFSLFLL